MTFRIFLVFLLLFTTRAIAEDRVVCSALACTTISLTEQDLRGNHNFSNTEIWNIIEDIVQRTGLLPNFQLVSTTEVPNAAADIIDGERYILINPDWLRGLNPANKWETYGLVAHEIGHHLQGHILDGRGSRPPIELEADEYAGFVLSALGANQTEAKSLWLTLGGSDGSLTHPPGYQRLQAVERGWNRQQRNGGGAQNDPIPQGQYGNYELPMGRARVQNHPIPFNPPLPAASPNEYCGIVNFHIYSRAQICVSGTSDQAAGSGRYSAVNQLLDPTDTGKSWFESVPTRQDSAPYILIIFPEPISVEYVEITNGAAGSRQQFLDFARVNQMLTETSSGARIAFTIRDDRENQKMHFHGDEGQQLRWIRLSPQSYYRGGRWDEFALARMGVSFVQ